MNRDMPGDSVIGQAGQGVEECAVTQTNAKASPSNRQIKLSSGVGLVPV